MKSLVLEGNGILKVQNWEIKPPQDTECTIKILFAGICSSDIYRAFDNGAYFYPLVMGHEFSGEIVKLGKSVIGFNVGDKVTAFPLLPCFRCAACDAQLYSQCNDYKYYGSRNDGAFSEYLNVEQWNLMKIPSEVSLEDAALTEPFAVVMRGLNRLAIDKSCCSDLLIMGAGFLGLLFLDLIKNVNPNIKVTVIDRNQFKLDMAKMAGAEVFCIKTDEDYASFLSQKHCLFDIVAEFSGSPVNFSRSIELTKQGGKLLWLSNISADLSLSKKMVSSILRKEINILGTWNSEFKGFRNDDWQLCLEKYKEGIKPSKYINEFLNIDEMPHMFKKLFDHKSGTSKHDYIKYVCSF